MGFGQLDELDVHGRDARPGSGEMGIKFTRTGVLRAVPFIGIPVSAAVNELATRSLANRAIKFYDLHPRNGQG